MPQKCRRALSSLISWWQTLHRRRGVWEWYADQQGGQTSEGGLEGEMSQPRQEQSNEPQQTSSSVYWPRLQWNTISTQIYRVNSTYFRWGLQSSSSHHSLRQGLENKETISNGIKNEGDTYSGC